MKTAPIAVKSNGTGIAEAMAITEKAGKECGLDKKPILHLRLIAEELFGMLRGIAGEIEAEYRIEEQDKKFELHLTSTVQITEDMRKALISAASSGKNEAAKGFTGKIRVMIAGVMLSAKEMLPYAMINTVSAYPMGGYAAESASVWSMSLYKEEIKSLAEDNKEAAEAWDELEKSIIANIADDVKVKIVDKNVEITVCKAF